MERRSKRVNEDLQDLYTYLSKDPFVDCQKKVGVGGGIDHSLLELVPGGSIVTTVLKEVGPKGWVVIGKQGPHRSFTWKKVTEGGGDKRDHFHDLGR